MAMSNFLRKYNSRFWERQQQHHVQEPKRKKNDEEYDTRATEGEQSRSADGGLPATNSVTKRHNDVTKRRRTASPLPGSTILETRKNPTVAAAAVAVDPSPGASEAARKGPANPHCRVASSTPEPTTPPRPPKIVTREASKRRDEMVPQAPDLTSPGRMRTIPHNHSDASELTCTTASASCSVSTGPCSGSGASATASAVWICRACTLENQIRHRRCQACHERKPVEEEEVKVVAPTIATLPQFESDSFALPSPSSSSMSSTSTIQSKRQQSYLAPSPSSSSPSVPNAASSSRHPLRNQSTTPTPKKRKSPKSKTDVQSKKTRVTSQLEHNVVDAKQPQHHEMRMVPFAASTAVMESTTGNHPPQRSVATTNDHTITTSATTTAARVSTSPFVSILPLADSKPTSTTITTRDYGTSLTIHNNENTVNNRSLQMTAAIRGSITKDDTIFEMTILPQRWKSLLDQCEGEHQFLKQRVQFAEKHLQEMRLAWVEMQQRLEHAQQHVVQAQQQWRTFQHMYDDLRQTSILACNGLGNTTTMEADQPKHQTNQYRETSRPSMESPTPVDVAGRADRLPPTSSSMVSAPASEYAPRLSCQPIHTDTPVLSGIKLLPNVPRHSTAPRRTPTPKELHTAVAKLAAEAQNSPNRFELDSQSREPLALSLHGFPYDSQATIDPDLDPHYHMSLRRTQQHRRQQQQQQPRTLNDGPETTETSSSIIGRSETDHTNNVAPSKQSSLSVTQRRESAPARAEKVSKPASKSTERTSLPGWESTKPSRDFLAPRARLSSVKDSTRSDPQSLSSAKTAGGSSEAEWVRVARNARMEYRNRTKSRDEALWNDNGDSPSQQHKVGDNDEANRATTSKPNHPYQEVVRCKAQRQALPCHDCYSCRAFYAALDPSDALALLQNSRHRAQCSPSETPRDFWEVDFVDEIERERQQQQESDQLPNSNRSPTTDHSDNAMDQIL